MDFVVNRFLMKLLKTSNIEIDGVCQCQFAFQLPSVTLARRTECIELVSFRSILHNSAPFSHKWPVYDQWDDKDPYA